MFKKIGLTLSLLCTLGFSHADETVQVSMMTNKGEIILELYPEKAPETVKNFVNYVENGFYDGLIFHRVIPGFMIQGGGFDKDMTQKETDAPIKNEADNGLENTIGTIAMARTNDPNSATSQFFINTANNNFLDFKSATAQGYGYAVFGKVIEGMDAVNAIEKVETTTKGFHQNVPVDAMLIEAVKILPN